MTDDDWDQCGDKNLASVEAPSQRCDEEGKETSNVIGWYDERLLLYGCAAGKDCVDVCWQKEGDAEHSDVIEKENERGG